MFNSVMDKGDENSYHGSSFFLSRPTTPSTPSSSGTRLYGPSQLIVENRLYDQLLRRYRLAAARLRELVREADALQEENDWLRLANEELTRRINGLQPSEGSTSLRNNRSTNSPTSVLEYDVDEEEDNEVRFTLPRSISVRSPSYFKLLINSPTSHAASPTRSPIACQHVNTTKLRVQRSQEKAAEREVFNQGMYKTELCNKWQETGTCPYGDQCRFAHGLSELRPVIRHPKYKTQVCRMVLAGVTCPYGHRCHFRHSLTATTTRLRS